MTRPTVGVVVVNYNGGELTLECLRSVVRTDWPGGQLHVVLVDNASTDGVVARVRSELPVVEIVELDANRGFGAGCNAGIRALGAVDFVALVNNDATVDPGWLVPLVEALDADADLGAACPKILFAGRFRDVELRSATSRRGFGDRRDLGAFVSGAGVNDDDVWSRVAARRRHLGPRARRRSRRRMDRARRAPPRPRPGRGRRATTVSLRLSADGPARGLAAGRWRGGRAHRRL